MGGAASISQLPLTLTKEQVKLFSGSNYDEELFNSMVDPSTNTITKEQLIKVLTRTDVFLTHDWGHELGQDNHAKVGMINKLIKSRGLSTWFDEEKMEGNIKKQMAAGIDNAQCVVVFITKRYVDKVAGTNTEDNCQLEFNYSARRKGANKMIAVVMEERMRNDASWVGEVGLVLGGRLYADMAGDFGDSDYLNRCADDLYSRIIKVIGKPVPTIDVNINPNIHTPNNSINQSDSMGSNSSQTKKLTKPLNTLTINEIAALLNTLNLGKFVDAFKENEVDGRTLSMCKNEDEIVELGVSIQSKARVLYTTIQTYKFEGVPLADINQETIFSEKLSNLSSLTTSISTVNNNNNNSNNTDDYYLNLYLKCICGDLNSFNELESQSRIEVENIVCLGYLMIVLNGNISTANNIPKDNERSISIGREIIGKLKEKKRSSSLNHHKEFILGVMYDYGIGVNIDYEEAVKWYRLSADQGNFDAQYNLGNCYCNGRGVNKDYEEAIKWFKLSSDQGYSLAQYNLGVCYYNGEGDDQDYEEAVKWFRLSADQGYSDAQYNLGYCYYNGEGVNKDFREAVKWFRLSANQGYSSAQYNLGICYCYGEGVDQDYEEAIKWFKLSANQRNSLAQNALNEINKVYK